jgi:hypothetical protein
MREGGRNGASHIRWSCRSDHHWAARTAERQQALQGDKRAGEGTRKSVEKRRYSHSTFTSTCSSVDPVESDRIGGVHEVSYCLEGGSKTLLFSKLRKGDSRRRGSTATLQYACDEDDSGTREPAVVATSEGESGSGIDEGWGRRKGRRTRRQAEKNNGTPLCSVAAACT